MGIANNINPADGNDSVIESRNATREPIHTEILICQSGQKLSRATLSDISVSGFKLTSKRSLNPAQPVFIRLPGIQSLSATIRWEGFKDYGCQFTRTLNPKIFEQLVSKLRSLNPTSD
ncbi:PilZ domain-containing protein [Parasphingorhabdus sp.]|uniref:PilZ domain-containing protein n=1 Tax=Parasphingorhabdus sp. TaxID=2709688 RepID=UPI003FA792AD